MLWHVTASLENPYIMLYYSSSPSSPPFPCRLCVALLDVAIDMSARRAISKGGFLFFELRADFGSYSARVGGFVCPVVNGLACRSVCMFPCLPFFFCFRYAYERIIFYFCPSVVLSVRRCLICRYAMSLRHNSVFFSSQSSLFVFDFERKTPSSSSFSADAVGSVPRLVTFGFILWRSDDLWYIRRG